jgi:RimJ/RimL family protein N-acetyltransferase
MQLAKFIDYHRPTLEANEAKYNLILGILGSPSAPGLQLWTLDGPGACAIRSPGYPIILGALTEAQCHRLADDTRTLDYPGVVGSDATARWFVERGGNFHAPIPLHIQVLDRAPTYPAASGYARQVSAEDIAVFSEWMLAFRDEAVPHDPRPSGQQLEIMAGDGRYSLWIVDGRPVSMAGISRRTRNSAAISGVYTPPSLRGRGYAGSATAAVADRIFAEGKAAACLYTDQRNPFSNRCYARIGFAPVCTAEHYERSSAA